MHAAALKVELRIPGVSSIKEKRSVIRPVVEGLRRTASVSVAQVGRHDAWQRSTLGVALVAPDPTSLDDHIDRIRRYLGGCLEVEVLDILLSHLEDPE